MPQRLKSSTARQGDVYRALASFRNLMPVPCSRCKRQNEHCFVNGRSSRCKACNDAHKSCDLRVTFAQFRQLAHHRRTLVNQAEAADEELWKAEEEAARTTATAQQRVTETRSRSQVLHKQLREAQQKEDEAYERELASVEAMNRLEPNESLELASGSPPDGMMGMACVEEMKCQERAQLHEGLWDQTHLVSTEQEGEKSDQNTNVGSTIASFIYGEGQPIGVTESRRVEHILNGQSADEGTVHCLEVERQPPSFDDSDDPQEVQRTDMPAVLPMFLGFDLPDPDVFPNTLDASSVDWLSSIDFSPLPHSL